MALFSRKSSPSSHPPRRRALDTSEQQLRSQERDRQATVYRRGRTLAGSTSHTLRSGEPHALSAATPREKVHHLTRMRKKLSFTLSMLLIVILLLAVFLQQFTASVTVSFGDAPRIGDGTKYQDTLQEYLSQNPLERLRFNMDTERLNRYVTSKLPEVERIAPAGATGLVSSGFDITLRRPVVSWQVDNMQYFVDEHGVSFTESVYDAPPVKIVDNSGVNYTAGAAIASERFLAFVGQAVALTSRADLDVTQVSIPTGTSRQVELSLEGRSYPVIMSIDRSVGEQVEDMSRVVMYFDAQQVSPRYVDLRVKGKVFYRD